MLIVTEFTTLVKGLEKLSSQNIQDKIIAYYTENDSIPMSVYKKLNEMEKTIELLPMAEINNPKNMVFAALVDATSNEEHEVCVVADVKPSIYEFTVKGASYKVHIRNDFDIKPSQTSNTQPSSINPKSEIQKNNKTNTPPGSKPGVNKDVVDTNMKEDVRELPFFNEFMSNITTSTIPQDITKDKYAEILITAMRNNPDDKSIIDYIKKEISSAGLDNSIEILQMSGKFDRLKDIARS